MSRYNFRQSTIEKSKKYQPKIPPTENVHVHTWRCTICHVDMGIHNPRQLCCKTFCPKMFD